MKILLTVLFVCILVLTSNSQTRHFVNRYNSLSTGLLSFTFDDQFDSTVVKAFPLLDSFRFSYSVGYDGRLFAQSNFSVPYAQANDSQLLYWQNRGASINAHSWYLQDPNLQTAQQLRNNFYTLESAMRKRGFKSYRIISWPYGHNSSASILGDLFDYGKRCNNQVYANEMDSVPITTSNRLNTSNSMPFNTTPLSSLKSQIATAISQHKWHSERLHLIGGDTAYNLNMKLDSFRSYLSFVKSKVDSGLLVVITPDQMLKKIPSIVGLSQTFDTNGTQIVRAVGYGFLINNIVTKIDTTICVVTSHSDTPQLDDIKLEVSHDNGSSWAIIISDTPNTGSYSWVVTGPAAAQSIIRYSGVNNTDIVAQTVSFAIVAQVVTALTIFPSPAYVPPGGSQQFTALDYDQGGNAMLTPSTISWSVLGGGSIGSSTGLFTADSTPGGPYTITATAGSISYTITAKNAFVSPLNPVFVCNALGGGLCLDLSKDKIVLVSGNMAVVS